MKAKIIFIGTDVSSVQFSAELDDGRIIVESKPSSLAKALVDVGIRPGDAHWIDSSCENKFDDLLIAVKAGNDTLIRMYEFELWRRMS